MHKYNIDWKKFNHIKAVSSNCEAFSCGCNTAPMTFEFHYIF